jgi:two-component system, cell cycle sensor histidine kinase PleC
MIRTASDTIEIPRHNFHIAERLFPIFRRRKAVAAPPNEDSQGKWPGELLELFLRNQLNLAPIMPILAMLMALTAISWVPVQVVMFWLVGTLGCHSLQLFLCNRYFLQERAQSDQRDWIGMISASELFQGVFWALPLFLFWQDSSDVQRMFMMVSIMAVCAVRLLVVSNFMPVLIAGTGVIALGVALRCAFGNSPIFYSMAGLVVMLEVFFLFVARQLQETARERLVFRAQKDDLIEQLRLEKERAETERAKAEDANRAKSMFLANMSHELRTPLNAIMGFSEVLENEMFGPIQNKAYKNYAGDIHNSGRYLLTLINDILDLSRIEAGRRDIHEEPTHMIDCLHHASTLLQARSDEKKLSVSIDAPGSLPKLLCDYRALNQIAINLLTNAVKFTPDNGTIRMKAEVLPDGRMAMSVADDGPGIPKAEQQQLMMAFSRGAQATKLAIEGAGLGLPIVKGLMEAHSGSLSIRSEPGQGTEITCYFPAARVLSGPRGATISSDSVKTATQRKLISITG